MGVLKPLLKNDLCFLLNRPRGSFTPMKLPPGYNFFKTVQAADERIPLDAVAFGAETIYELLNRYKA
jgi:hypothetical protein